MPESVRFKPQYCKRKEGRNEGKKERKKVGRLGGKGVGFSYLEILLMMPP
jgi:hypothetical protein